MDSNLSEKQEYENCIRSLGIVPNHNYLVLWRGPTPTLYTIFRTNPTYRVLGNKLYLLIFTNQNIIFKNIDPDSNNSKIMTIKHDDVTNFTVHDLVFNYYTCISFETNKKYYFYIDVNSVFSSEESNYSTVNFNLLLENNFYGLLKK